jgi:hypothetical protein
MAEQWNCKECGIVNQRSALRCMGCGIATVTHIILTCEATGEELQTSQKLTIGRALLTKLGPEAKYAAEPQFHLERNTETGIWCVYPIPGTPNKTYTNALVLTESGATLEPGFIIEIGPGKMKLLVRLETP